MPEPREREALSASTGELDFATLEDQELCALVRENPKSEVASAAFGEIYQRHQDTLTAQAYLLTHDKEAAAELVSEAFTRTLRALSNGMGPTESVCGYLLISLRSEGIRGYASDEGEVLRAPDDLDYLSDERQFEPDFVDTLSERDQISRAFATLSQDDRRVLWLIEVEQLATASASEYLGISEGAARVQLHRARKRLGTAYLQQHAERAAPECASVVPLLAPHLRGSTSKGADAQVQAHLDHCDSCAGQVTRLNSLQGQLRSLAGPLILGGGVVGALSLTNAPSATAATHSTAVSGGAAGKVAVWAGAGLGVALLVGGIFMLLPGAPDSNPVEPTGVTQPVDEAQEELPAPAPQTPQPATPGTSGTGGSTPSRGSNLGGGSTPAQPDLDEGAAVTQDDATPNWRLEDD